MIESFIFAKVKFHAFNGLGSFPCYSQSGDPRTLEFFMKLDEGMDRYTFRILYPPKEIVYGEEYVVQMRFLVPSVVIPRLKINQRFEIESVKIIGEGLILEIHDYKDLIGPWNQANDPWSGMPFKHPDFYLRLRQNKYPVCACFVSRRIRDGNGNCFHVARIAPSIGDDCREIVVLEYSSNVGIVIEVWMAVRDDAGILRADRHIGVGMIGPWKEVGLHTNMSSLNGLKEDALIQMRQLFNGLSIAPL